MTRLFDLLLSGLAFLVLSPLLIPLCVILRLTGEGEIFFVQLRVGQGGQHFGLYKFATMLKDSPNVGTGTVTLKDDPRVLPFGRLLRRAKINELPQLINVLKGDMSLIGPRPQTPRCFDAFPAECRSEIIKVRPGLSGVGSIVFRGEEDMIFASNDPTHFYDHVIMPYKGLLECWFVKNASMKLYFQCIFLTACAVLHSRNALVWRFLNGIPQPPERLKARLYFDLR